MGGANSQEEDALKQGRLTLLRRALRDAAHAGDEGKVQRTLELMKADMQGKPTDADAKAPSLEARRLDRHTALLMGLDSGAGRLSALTRSFSTASHFEPRGWLRLTARQQGGAGTTKNKTNMAPVPPNGTH